VWQTNTVFDEHALLEELPPFLRDEVVNEAYGDLVDAVPMLQNLAPSELTSLMVRLHPLRVLPSQVIVRRGELGTEMYIVSGGLLRTYFEPNYPHQKSFLMDAQEMTRAGTVLLPGQKPARGERPPEAFGRPDLLGRGDYFGHYCIIGGGDEDGDGEIDLIGDEEEDINARHPYTVVAVQMSMLLSLSRPDFEDAKMLFPNLAFQLARNSKQPRNVLNTREHIKSHIRTIMEMVKGGTNAEYLDHIDYNKSLHKIGLDSLLRAQLRGWLRHEMEVDLPLQFFDERVTLSEITDAVETEKMTQELPSLSVSYENAQEQTTQANTEAEEKKLVVETLERQSESDNSTTTTRSTSSRSPLSVGCEATRSDYELTTSALQEMSKEELIQLSRTAMQLASEAS
jgi:CRP-like cAMP-binding protein